MKVFDSTHAKGNFWGHAKRAGFISGLFLGAGLLGLVHMIFPFFLPEVMTLANKRISQELEVALCACPEEWK